MGTFIQDLKLVAKQSILNFRYIFGNKSIFLQLSMFFMIGTFLPIVFIPLWMCTPIILQVTAFIPAAILYGSFTYNFRKSTLNQNTRTTRNNKWTFYISSILTMEVIAFSMFFMQILILLILNNFDLLLYAWFTKPTGNEYQFANLDWLNVIYSVGVGTILTFSIIFAVQPILKTQKSFYVFVLSLLILSVIFGGTLNDYFIVHQIINDNTYTYWNQDTFTLFPKSIFVPTSLFFPFFNIGETSITIFKGIQFDGINWQNVDFWKWNITEGGWHWNMCLIMPYVHIVFFGIVGVLLSKATKK